MNNQKQIIHGLDDIYRKTFLLAADVDGDVAEDLLALMFIKYAKTHNSSGKFDQIFSDEVLINNCEIYLMNIGNSSYFDHKLKSYQDNLDLLHMLGDALKMLDVHNAEILQRKDDPSFIEKIRDGHLSVIMELDNRLDALKAEFDKKNKELTKIGFVLRNSVRKKQYTRLEKEVKELDEEIERVSDELSELETKYKQCHADYFWYMMNMSCEDADKITRYFFSEETDEQFEQLYGISNKFKADRHWLLEQIEAANKRIGADCEKHMHFEDMLQQAKQNKKEN